MERRGGIDLIGGSLLSLTGLFFFVRAFGYGIGSAGEMQPGYYPMAVGLIATIIGAAIAVPAFGRTGVLPRIAWRPMAAVLLGLAAFALLIERIGLVPSVFLAVVLSALGDKETRLAGSLILGAAVSAVIWLIFSVGLRLPVPAFGRLL